MVYAKCDVSVIELNGALLALCGATTVLSIVPTKFVTLIGPTTLAFCTIQVGLSSTHGSWPFLPYHIVDYVLSQL